MRRLSYHGVFTHQNDSISSKTLANLVHLLRADIVDGYDEDGLVFLQQCLELVEVYRFISCLAPHVFL